MMRNGGPDPAAILLGVMVVLIIAIPIGLAIGAVLLRAAAAVTNKVLGGGGGGRRYGEYSGRGDFGYDRYDRPDYEYEYGHAPSGVPQPSFGRAMGTVAIAALINMPVGFVIGLVVGVAGVALRLPDAAVQLLAQAVSLPASFVIMAWTVSFMFPTSFGRAALVTLFYFLIALAIAMVIGIGVAILMVAVIGLR